jgi:hypothetical protein
MARARPAKGDEQLRKELMAKSKVNFYAMLFALSVLLTLTLIFGFDSFAVCAIA